MKSLDISVKNENARDNFLRRPNQRNYKEYERRMETLEKHKLFCARHEQMDKLLNRFRIQVMKAAEKYYRILQEVIYNLQETFEENNKTSEAAQGSPEPKFFNLSLFTWDDIRDETEKMVKNFQPEDMWSSFIGLFLEQESRWLSQDENSIRKLVNDFITDIAFPGLAQNTFFECLAEKYQTENTDVLGEKLYEDYLERSMESYSRPFFAFNCYSWDRFRSGITVRVVLPQGNAAVAKRAEEKGKNSPRYLQNWRNGERSWTRGNLTDRIYVTQTICGFPACSYKWNEGEKIYYSSPIPPGLHSYVGNEKDFFSDWNHLPPLNSEEQHRV